MPHEKQDSEELRRNSKGDLNRATLRGAAVENNLRTQTRELRMFRCAGASKQKLRYERRAKK